MIDEYFQKNLLNVKTTNLYAYVYNFFVLSVYAHGYDLKSLIARMLLDPGITAAREKANNMK